MGVRKMQDWQSAPQSVTTIEDRGRVWAHHHVRAVGDGVSVVNFGLGLRRVERRKHSHYCNAMRLFSYQW